MATQAAPSSQEFIFDDPLGSGKKYRVRSDDPNATREQAAEHLNSVPVEELSQYELQAPSAVAPQQAAPAVPEAVPAAPIEQVVQEPVSNNTGTVTLTPGVEAQPRNVTAAAQKMDIAANQIFDAPEEFKRLTPEQEAEYLNLVNNPNVPIEQLNEYMVKAGRMSLPPEEIAAIEKLREEGKASSLVVYDNPFEGMEDQEYLKTLEDNGDRGWGAQFGRSILAAWADPATGTGMMARGISDLLDTGKDKLREQFPNASEEQLEEMSERYAAYLNRKVFEARERGVRNDDMVPWLVGQFAALDPIDILPFGRAARASTKAGKIAEKGVEAGLVAGAANVGYQAAAINAGAQDRYDPLSTAMEVGLSGVLGAGAQGLDNVVSARLNPPAAREAKIIAPTSARNTKKYKIELAEATSKTQDQVLDLTGRWTNPPKEVKVLDNFKGEKDIDDDALGVYTADGRVLINTEAVIANAKRRGITPDEMVDTLVFHEALGHHGLTQTFGNDLDTMLDVIYTEGKAEFRDLVDSWIKRNTKKDKNGNVISEPYPSPTNSKAVDRKWQRIRATEEVLAGMSEEGLVDRTLLDRFFDMIKRYARQTGLDKLAQRLDEDIGKYSTREIRGILAVSQRNVTKGGPTNFAPGSVKNKIVYHGSGANFDKFDHSKMGTGEGQQIFGWGTYLTDVENIAKSYKEKLSRQDVSFGGRRGPIWQLRDIAEVKAEEANLSDEAMEALDAAFSVKSQFYPNREITGRVVYDDFLATIEDPDWTQTPQAFRDALDEAAKFVNDNYKAEYSGKTYEVDIPDDAKWLEWEVPLSEQTELRKALEAKGIKVVDEARRKELVTRLQEINKERRDPEITYEKDKELDQELDVLYNEIQNSIPVENVGEEVYSELTRILKGDREASQFLAENGFTGNRYLANNISRKRARQAENNKFNYVVFDDKTPKIVNKYMRSDGPIDPDELSAEDLVGAQNAMDLLDRVLDNYTPTAVDIANIENDLIDRGVSPSSVLRLARTNPGELVRRRMRYDIAAMKLNDRVLAIEEDIKTNGLTEEKQLDMLKADFALQEITSAIFDMDSEFGRALNQLKKMSFTRNKATNLREFLKDYDLGEGLADPETFMNYMAMRADAVKADKAKAADNGKMIYQISGLPRAIMSSMDLSAPMRQGITFIGNAEYWKSFFKMFTFMGPSGRRNYDWLMKSIAAGPNYDLMLKARLSFSELDGKLSGREEDFQTDLARKIFILGKGVKISEQAYAGFLNKLRADMFNKLVEAYRNPDGTVDDKLLTDLGSFINSATGRAELSKDLLGTGINLQASSSALNAAFFSPRLIQSRFNMLNPRYYMKLDKRIRNRAIWEMVKMGVAMNTLTWGIALMTPDAEVEIDPRSSDFMKIKVGDTRFDLGGGYFQYLTLGARSYLWMQNAVFGTSVPEIKTTTGKERDLDGRGMFGRTYGDELWRFFRSKLSPNISYAVDAFEGENVVGEPFDIAGSAADRILPMTVSSLIDNTEVYGMEKGVRYSTPNLFGISTSTFYPPERNPYQTLDAPPTFEGADLDRAAKDWWENRLNGHFRTLTELYTAETGKRWAELPNEVQEQIVTDAKEEAKRYTKEDAAEELMEQ